MKLITYENIPCWYELSFRENYPAIVLRLHRDLVKQMPIVKNDVPFIASFIQEFKFNSFNGDLTGDFGFNGSFVRGQSKDDEFIELIVKIPTIKKPAGKCTFCNGSGRDKYLRTECISCDGSGKGYDFDWQTAYAISASFTTFFHLISCPEQETSSSLMQLLVVQTITVRDMHGGSLGGKYGVSLVKWLGSLWASGNSEMHEMTNAMKVVYKKLFKKVDVFDCHQTWAKVEDQRGWLNVSCPGDACGLQPSFDYSLREGRGYEFDCHNVDNPMQQITLLAGLAALHDKARKEMKA